MRIERAKKLHKTLNFYKYNYGFREPFQVLIDGTFCYGAIKEKVNIKEHLAKYFPSELKLLTTSCMIIEAEKMGPKVSKAAYEVKQFAIHKCGHEGNPISGSNCMKEMSKQTRYFIATQDWELQGWIRKQAGQPLFFLHKGTLILERPSIMSKKHASKKLNAAVDINPYQKDNLNKMKAQAGINDECDKKKINKQKKKKNPNPLSCKKKRNKSDVGSNLVSSGIQKKKKSKVSKNIRESLKQTQKTMCTESGTSSTS